VRPCVWPLLSSFPSWLTLTVSGKCRKV
jgi:hypothetical protein